MRFLEWLVPSAQAHEVYVLKTTEAHEAIKGASPNPFTAISGNEMLFAGWAFGLLVLFVLVLRISISPLFERVFDPVLTRLKKYSPIVARVTFGISFFASGYFGDFFGPELSVSSIVDPAFVHFVNILLMVIGVCLILGLLTRIVSLIGVILFALTLYVDRWYMFTYINYLGEAILFLIIGSGMFSLDRVVPYLSRLEKKTAFLRKKMEKYSFLILRILFGSAVIFASFYAKFLHSNLALQTVADYGLTDFFPFPPLFLVLGAFLVESVIGLCIVLGFQIRFISLVFTFFLTLSIIFFGEAVWPHIILFGVNIALFFHGYDKYTVEMKFFQGKRRGEPVF